VNASSCPSGFDGLPGQTVECVAHDDVRGVDERVLDEELGDAGEVVVIIVVAVTRASENVDSGRRIERTGRARLGPGSGESEREHRRRNEDENE